VLYYRGAADPAQSEAANEAKRRRFSATEAAEAEDIGRMRCAKNVA
jgi:hypothetical protein